MYYGYRIKNRWSSTVLPNTSNLKNKHLSTPSTRSYEWYNTSDINLRVIPAGGTSQSTNYLLTYRSWFIAFLRCPMINEHIQYHHINPSSTRRYECYQHIACIFSRKCSHSFFNYHWHVFKFNLNLFLARTCLACQYWQCHANTHNRYYFRWRYARCARRELLWIEVLSVIDSRNRMRSNRSGLIILTESCSRNWLRYDMEILMGNTM